MTTEITKARSAGAKCAYCPNFANYYIVDLDNLMDSHYVCIRHTNKLATEGHPKDQRASEDQSSDAAHRTEDP